MRTRFFVAVACGVCGLLAGSVAQGRAQAGQDDDPIRVLVARLDLDSYKATIKGLTAFGDRRQGTERNRKAVDWIEARLKSYGCTNTERITYQYAAPVRSGGAGNRGAGQGRAGAAQAGRGQGGRAGGRGATPANTGTPTGGEVGRNGTGPGGSTIFGYRARTGVNTDPMAQPDEALRALNTEPAADGERQEVYCTKIGTTHPEEMYIVAGHMDGHGWGEAANDDGSGAALVMELARVLSAPDVETERSIRFALWNNEETGLNGAQAYVEQRAGLQGKEDPVGSGRYPEPNWLGMIQHDMMLWDHGMPRADGTVSKEQRPEADVNIEFQTTAKAAAGAQTLAWFLKAANDKYATDYPASVGPHMTNTDSGPFMDLIPAISLRENERGAQIGAGWDPNWHQVTDVYSTYSDKDFRLGLNAGQTTLAAIAQLTGATVRK
jgi:Peptidase family M28